MSPRSPLQPLKLCWESEALRLATICQRSDSGAGEKLDRCAEGRETSWILNGLSAGLGSRELEAGSQNPEAMRRASGEGSLPGVSAVQRLKRGWGWGGVGIGWLAGGLALISPQNLRRARRDLGPGAALHWTFIRMLGQTTSDSGVWVQGPSCEYLAQRQHRVHLFDHLGGQVEASTLLCHIP